jgi:N-acetylglucosaminyldiphosphoundecaprenol N-acetyl-beta-D-mannosaminyltransferase
MPDKIAILGVPVHNLTQDETLHHFRAILTHERDCLHQIATVNPEFIMMARRNTTFARVLQNVQLATPDGVGITLAARIQGRHVRERLTGVDLTEMIATMSDPAPSIFLLGAGPGVAGEAAEQLRRVNPEVHIAGTFSGSPGDEDLSEILERLRVSGSDTLLVAFGAPEQDMWIARHRQALAACGIVIAIGVGGTFDYLSGRVPRAPRLIRRIGLEWLYRLIRQPWRWRRQLALPQFAALVIWERLTGKGKVSVRNHGSTQR